MHHSIPNSSLDASKQFQGFGDSVPHANTPHVERSLAALEAALDSDSTNQQHSTTHHGEGEEPSSWIPAWAKTVRLIMQQRLSPLFTCRAVEAAAKTFFSDHRHLLMPAGLQQKGNFTSYGRNLLVRDTEHGFVVLAMVWPPGTGSPAHDHGVSTWGVVSVVDGELEVTNYERRDDGSEHLHAELVPVLTVTGNFHGFAPKKKFSDVRNVFPAHKGSVGHVIQPWNDIHAIFNRSTTQSISIHTYAREPVEFHRYNLKTEHMESAHLSYDFVWDGK